MLPRFASFVLMLGLALGCGDDDRVSRDGRPVDLGMDGGNQPRDFGQPRDIGPLPDRSFLPPDAACATATAEAEVERLPVDIIWVVDNSVSMEPAIEQVNAGLNDFTSRIAASGLDYRVIMLSLRGRGEISVSGRSRYGVCIPEPLAGDSSCGDGTRFFQVEVDIHSTQPIEQILGTLGQSSGYTAGTAHGSEPWSFLLRREATKTFVVVTDDNSRTCDRSGGGSCAGGDPPLTVTSLEDFPGGPNPFNSRELGPGLLTPTYGELFEGYLFSALYGWGSESNPDITCMYPGGEEPPSPGQTYSALVARTGGVRAQICEGAAAWGPFFDSVATAVTRTSRIECELPMPAPPDGMALDVDRVNVSVRGSLGDSTIPRVDAGTCDDRGGWHYDDPVNPSQVILCPATCEQAQEEITEPTHGVSVLFGCETILI